MLNNTIIEMKKILVGINNKILEAEKWVSKMKVGMVEITFEEENKKRKVRKIEDKLRDLWDKIKLTNI